jgi:predicted TIM-barrel fold metal-dependent hydrolase
MPGSPASQSSPFAAVRPDWLGLQREEAIDPDLPIIDCHHHLWTRAECPYEVDDLLQDANGGHNVLATVFVECRTRYRSEGPRERRSLGETEYAADAGDAAGGNPGNSVRVNAGIVGYVDLQCGRETVAELLGQHVEQGRGRLRGIRNLASTTAEQQFDRPAGVPSLLMSPAFREGFSLLRSHNLLFDAWIFHNQLSDLVDLARQFPDIPIVVNHAGGPAGIGPKSPNYTAAYQLWQERLQWVASCPNVSLKIGGLGMPHVGFGFHELKQPPTSDQLVEAWQPLVDECIRAFGTGRCMFESNFPVDKGSYSYVTLWNAFKKLTRDHSQPDRERLFSKTAARVYRLDIG